MSIKQKFVIEYKGKIALDPNEIKKNLIWLWLKEDLYSDGSQFELNVEECKENFKVRNK